MIGKKKADYAAEGHPLDTDLDAEKELVAQEVQQRLLINERELQDLFLDAPTLGQRFIAWCDRMLARTKNGESARERVYLQEVRERMQRAWVSANKERRQGRYHAAQETAGPQEDEYREDMDWMEDEELDDWLDIQDHEAAVEEGAEELGRQYSFRGYSEDGRGIYESNFPKGTPKRAKGERILRYIQDVWSKKPITLRIEDQNGIRYIEARFDPEYDDKHGYQSDASKLMGGNRHGTSAEQRVTLDLADDYYQIASEATYNYSKPETGKTSLPHQDVRNWHYFVNDILFQEHGETELVPYRVTINVKEKENGNFVYSFSAEKQKEELNTQRTLHAAVTPTVESESNAQLFDSSIAKNEKNVNRQYSLNTPTVSKRDVAWDLRAILSRGGDPRELQQYVSRLEQNSGRAEQTGGNRYQTGVNRNSTAREILQAAHRNGQSVEEYLRWNPEQYERDGKWRPEALEAMRMEQGGGRRQYSINTTNAYQDASLSEDGDVYTYDFLTHLPDMQTVILSDIADIRDGNNRVDTARVIDLGRKNALSVGEERDGDIYVTNRYTGRELKITNASIRHGLEGSMNRLLTNARLGSVIGEVVQNAVPINALHNKAQGVEGTYAMAGYAADTSGREFVAIITVEQRNGTVAGIDVYDLTHAVSGRQKKRQPVGHEVPGNYPPSVASEISIEDFLPVVKEVYQSILPMDVLDKLGESRNPMGHYSNQVKFSLNTEEENAESQARESRSDGQKEVTPVTRDTLDQQGKKLLHSIETRLIHAIGRTMDVPQHMRYTNMKTVATEMADEYLAKGTISEEKVNELFDKAYAAGVHDNAEFFDKSKDIRNMIRTTAVTVSEEDKALIPERDRRTVFWNMRIVDYGGVSIEQLYADLQERAPELFPEYHDGTVEKLVRVSKLAEEIRRGERTLQEASGKDGEIYRKWKMNDFRKAMEYMMRDLRDLRRYAEDGMKEEQKEIPQILTPEDAMREMEQHRKLRKAVDKAESRNALTTSDHIQIGRLLKGEIQPEHLDESKYNVKGIMAVYTAKLAYEEQCEVVRAYKSRVRAERSKEADELLETANTWTDKKAGILYARETMARNIRDIVNDRALADKINRTYFEPVQIAEAEKTRFLNEYRERINDLKISSKPHKGDKVSEAYAVQFLGEAMDHIRVMEKNRGRIQKRADKTLEEWRAEVADLWMNSPNLDKAKIEHAVKEFRKIYDEVLPMMNKVLVANGYEPVPYRQGYFPHFQEGSTGLLAYFGKLVGMDTRIDTLPTTINGLTHTFRPGKQWFGHGLERSGDETAYDALQGFDIYIEGAAGVIFHTENIQKLRAFEDRIRYRTSDKGIQEQVDAVMRSDLTEEEKKVQKDAIYAHGRSSLSNLAVELREYTNLLANKKSKHDRGMESFLGRRTYTFMKNWENRVGANMIAANFSSAMTNWIPLTSAAAQLNPKAVTQAVWDTAMRKRKEDGFIDRSDFLTSRRGSQRVSMTGLQKAAQKAGFLMELIDNTTSEIIVRAAYLHNLGTNLSEAEALHQADLFAAGVMADRSKGAMPTLFEARNPLYKAFTQFQLEVNNQFSEVMKDIPRRYLSQDFSMRNWRGLKRDELAEYAGTMFVYWLLSYLFNDLYEKFIGRRPALDPIGILNHAVGDLTGYEVPNLADMIWDAASGEGISFRTEKVGVGEAVSNLATDVIGELPFSAGLNLIGIETDGGRLPVASTIPDFSAVWDAATKKDLTGAERLDMLKGELEKWVYVVPPFGGGQLLKSYKGIKAVIEGGSYSLDKEGEEILQYPVYTDDPDDLFWSLVRAAFMGKNSLPEAQDWVENGYNSLSAKETAVYKELLNTGMKDREAYDLIRRIKSITDTESRAQKGGRAKLILGEDVSGEVKNLLYYALLAGEAEQFRMEHLTEEGVDPGAATELVYGLWRVGSNAPSSEKWHDWEELFNRTPMTEEEKHFAMRYVLGEEMTTDTGNPSAYAKYLSAVELGLSNAQYMQLRNFGTSIDKYLELRDAGIGNDGAVTLAMELDRLEPDDGYDKVHWTAKGKVITEAGISESEQMAALEMAVPYESTYEKMKIGYNLGMNVKSYVDLKSVMSNFDADGNGSYSQQETEDAINALAGDDNVLYALTGTTPNGYTLSDREKAILWQLQDKRWSPKRNPFDREVGQMVYDILTAEDPEDAAAGADGGNGFDVGSLLALMK